MQYGDLVKVYEAIESTTSRLEMADILAGLFKSSDCKDIRTIVYMTQGNIVPDFYPEKLGVADKLYLSALSKATGQKPSVIKELWDKEGDTGRVTELIFANKHQTTLFSQELTLERVHTALLKVCQADGDGSQDAKMKHLANILHDAQPNEAKYIARLATGRMRIGIAAQTVIDALALAFATKADKPDIERAFNITSDLGLVGETLCSSGLEGVRDLHVRVGNPIRAMLAERLSSPEELLDRLNGRAIFEYKYDGLRIQAHVSKEKITLYSRRLEDMTDQFPDVAEALREAFTGTDAILEGECVPVDINTGEFLPFQEVSHRRGRKHALQSAVEDYPVRFHLFDCLYLNGEDLTLKPLPERRKSLAGCITATSSVRLSEAKILDNPEDVQSFFLAALADGCEGLMAKSIGNDSIYRAGARGYLWIKYKKEYRSEMNDTVDLVAVGAFYGRGKRGGTYGALLMATYNPETDMFETVCKLGSGFSDLDLVKIPQKLNEYKIDKRFPRVNSKLEADVWFEPFLVLEVRGAEITLSPTHTCAEGAVRDGSGFAIRFPRYTGTVRIDKEARDATASMEIFEMYGNQLKQTS